MTIDTIYYYLNGIITYHAGYKHSLQTSNHVTLKINWCVDKKYQVQNNWKKRERYTHAHTHTEKEDKGEKVGKKSVRKKTSPFRWIEIRGGG